MCLIGQGPKLYYNTDWGVVMIRGDGEGDEVG